MSDEIAAALEKAVKAASGGVKCVFENDPVYTPEDGVPYQIVNVVFGKPDNREFGSNYAEVGFCEVLLHYPKGTGRGAAGIQAKAIRTALRRGTTLTEGSTKVLIDETPSQDKRLPDPNRFILPVTIPFRSQAQG
jgi:hypothetical protein